MGISLLAGKNVWNESLSVGAGNANNYLIGYVNDSVTGYGLQYTKIIIGAFGTRQADIGGYFDIPGIPAGTYTIIFSLVGYVTQQVTGFQIWPNQNNWLNIQLVPV